MVGTPALHLARCLLRFWASVKATVKPATIDAVRFRHDARELELDEGGGDLGARQAGHARELVRAHAAVGHGLKQAPGLRRDGCDRRLADTSRVVFPATRQ